MRALVKGWPARGSRAQRLVRPSGCKEGGGLHTVTEGREARGLSAAHRGDAQHRLQRCMCGGAST